MMPRKLKEGDRFDRLVIIGAYSNKQSKHWQHTLRCDCGNIAVVAGGDLNKGTTRSCGCLKKEERLTHGMSKADEYPVWASMIQRCSNKNNDAYDNYGGRGITVCDEWMSFDSFFEDMGSRPNKAMTLERVDNDKGYSGSNCIWASRITQSINQRIRRDNKTGCRGVSIAKNRGGYVSIIQREHKRVYLGFFKNLDDAIAARKRAETNQMGETK